MVDIVLMNNGPNLDPPTSCENNSLIFVCDILIFARNTKETVWMKLTESESFTIFKRFICKWKGNKKLKNPEKCHEIRKSEVG